MPGESFNETNVLFHSPENQFTVSFNAVYRADFDK